MENNGSGNGKSSLNLPPEMYVFSCDNCTFRVIIEKQVKLLQCLLCTRGFYKLDAIIDPKFEIILKKPNEETNQRGSEAGEGLRGSEPDIKHGILG